MGNMAASSIVALARIFAQDTSASNPAVSDAVALPLLNDVLVRFAGDVNVKTALIPASESGLTFAANAAIGTATVSDDAYDSILAAYPSNSTSAPTVLPDGLQHWTVEEILAAYDNDGSGTVTGSGTREWQAFAWERMSSTQTDLGVSTIRVYVWPALAATRYLTLRVPKQIIIGDLTKSPDVTQREARLIARFLAWEMARLHCRDEAFLQQILAPIPERVLNAYFESAKTHGWLQSKPLYTGALDG